MALLGACLKSARRVVVPARKPPDGTTSTTEPLNGNRDRGRTSPRIATALSTVLLTASLLVVAGGHPARANDAGIGDLALSRSGLATSQQFGASDQTDVFAVDASGALTVTWVNGAGAWQGPARISSSNVAPPGAAITASQQFGASNQTDVFVVDNSGALTVTWVNGAGAWQGPARISGSNVAPPGAAVTASQQFGASNQTDVFVVDNSGALTVTWVNGTGPWRGPARITGSGF